MVKSIHSEGSFWFAAGFNNYSFKGREIEKASKKGVCVRESEREKGKIYETKKAQINSIGWQHTRVDNNKTNKAQASRFCSTTSPITPAGGYFDDMNNLVDILYSYRLVFMCAPWPEDFAVASLGCCPHCPLYSSGHICVSLVQSADVTKVWVVLLKWP